MAGLISPLKENFTYPFQIPYYNICTDFLPKFPQQRFLICFAESNVPARECKPIIIRGFLKQYFTVLHTNARYTI